MMETTIFADLQLARRLEAAEAHACAQFAEVRKRLYPGSDSTWMQCAGTTVVFDGVDAPTTQTFGLGLFEPVTDAALDEMEAFFKIRKADVMHEVCPLVGVEALDLLCKRGYRPIEVSNVMYRTVERPSLQTPGNVHVRVIGPDEAELWSRVSARGWTHEHPELEGFVRELGALCVAREGSHCFLAEVDGHDGAAGALSVHKGVALFAGSSTVPELRRRGLQSALLEERMHYAADAGCDLAMMVAEAGSGSQKNAERKGFRVGYTRVKWRLPLAGW